MLHNTVPGVFEVAQFNDVPKINPRSTLVAMAAMIGKF